MFLPEGSESAGRRRRFLLEAQAASKLNHPHIVTIHDVDRTNGVDFIVMAYVDGAPLHQLIPPDGLPLDRMLDYGRQIASALAAAHGAGTGTGLALQKSGVEDMEFFHFWVNRAFGRQ